MCFEWETEVKRLPRLVWRPNVTAANKSYSILSKHCLSTFAMASGLCQRPDFTYLLILPMSHTVFFIQLHTWTVPNKTSKGGSEIWTCRDASGVGQARAFPADIDFQIIFAIAAASGSGENTRYRWKGKIPESKGRTANSNGIRVNGQSKWFSTPRRARLRFDWEDQ